LTALDAGEFTGRPSRQASSLYTTRMNAWLVAVPNGARYNTKNLRPPNFLFGSSLLARTFVYDEFMVAPVNWGNRGHVSTETFATMVSLFVPRRCRQTRRRPDTGQREKGF